MPSWHASFTTLPRRTPTDPTVESGPASEAAPPLLVVAAFEPELAPLRARLSVAAPWVEVHLASLGVGLVAAALAAQEVLAARRYRAVLFVGTAGAYPGAGLRRGEVVVARRSRLADAAVVRREADFVADCGAALDADPALVLALAQEGATPAEVATTLAVTTHDALARALGTTAAAEHLETHAVAAAAQRAGVPWTAALGIANDVGAAGRDQWRAHHHEASEAVAAVVAAWLLDGD
jgi:futalosine hydrolase